MKHIIKIHGRILATALCAFVAGCGDDAPPKQADRPVRDSDELILVITAETPPYSYYDPGKDEFVGIEIDVARAAATKLGHRLTVRKEKFEDLLPMVKNGEADMAASGITITEGRLKDVDFTDTLASEGGKFLYRTGERVPTMITAESMRVGVVDSTTHDFYLTRHGIDPIRYRFCSDAVADLLAGKLDAIFYDMSVMEDEASKAGGTLSVTPLETRENFGIAISKKAKDLKNALNEAIAERCGK